jgi:hypothetical protein
MLLVMQWLDEGRPDDGAVRLSVLTAAADLDAGAGRQGALEVLSALSELEDGGRVTVALTPAGPRDPVITLSQAIRRDADRLFGASGPGGPPG